MPHAYISNNTTFHQTIPANFGHFQISDISDVITCLKTPNVVPLIQLMHNTSDIYCYAWQELVSFC